jgi:hypothetical protein
MMADQAAFDPHARHVLDTARGILIGLRRCPSEAAFHELLGAAQRHKVPVFALSWGLVHLACGGASTSHNVTDAQSAARREWGELFATGAESPLPAR